jgi:hypothetical protein
LETKSSLLFNPNPISNTSFSDGVFLNLNNDFNYEDLSGTICNNKNCSLSFKMHFEINKSIEKLKLEIISLLKENQVMLKKNGYGKRLIKKISNILEI